MTGERRSREGSGGRGATGILGGREVEGALVEVERWMTAVIEDGGSPPTLADTAALEHLHTGGKRLRARLALAACAALGGEVERAVGWAAACELLHNATLVHDDVQDGDRCRRGQPTVWVRHGAAQAINTGDLLFAAPYRAVARTTIDEALKWRLAEALSRHTTTVVRGQSIELRLHASMDTSAAGYRRAITAKTSALFELPVEGAALLHGANATRAREIASVFRPLGVLFQMQDDVLDLYGDKGRDLVGADLREGKISILVVCHLERHPEDTPWLHAVLTAPREETDEMQVRRAIDRFREAGSLDAALDAIDREATAARRAAATSGVTGLERLMEDLVRRALAPIGHLLDARVDQRAQE